MARKLCISCIRALIWWRKKRLPDVYDARDEEIRRCIRTGDA